jgi:hypothetical protein
MATEKALLTDFIKLNVITHGPTCRKTADLKPTEQILVLVLFQHQKTWFIECSSAVRSFRWQPEQ